MKSANLPQLFYYFTPNTYWQHLSDDEFKRSLDGRFLDFILSKIDPKKYLAIHIGNSKRSSHVYIDVLASEIDMDKLKQIKFSEFFCGFNDENVEYLNRLQECEYEDQYDYNNEYKIHDSLIEASIILDVPSTNFKCASGVDEIDGTWHIHKFDFEINRISFQLKPKYNSYAKD